MLAFLDMIGGGEMLVLLVIGLLLFGRDLPDVGRKVGRVVAQLKRGMQDFKDQIDSESTMRDLKSTVQDTLHEVRRAASVPQILTDPANAVRELAHEAMHAPVESEPAAAPETAAQSVQTPVARGELHGEQGGTSPAASHP
jgi:Sec-independent protein translocase protein TatA